MYKTINGQNYFNEKSLAEICEVLEQGQAVKVYIDCIGHTRNNDEQEAYKEALCNKYGDKLQVSAENGGYSFAYVYKLN